MGLFNGGRKAGRPRKSGFGKSNVEKPASLIERIAQGPEKRKTTKKDQRKTDLFGNKIEEVKQEFDLKWTTKKRTHKDKWELERDFRNQFLDGKLKVVRSIALNQAGREVKRNMNGDIEYGY